MRYFSRQLSTLLVLSGTALLLMGADIPVVSNITSSVTCSVISSELTNSSISRTTGSIASKTTASVTSKTTGSLAGAVRSSATVSHLNRIAIPPIVLSPSEEELAKTLKFDRQVLLIIKGESQDHISRLIGFNEEGYQLLAPGIVVSVQECKAENLLSSLRQKLHPLKYMAFVVEMNEGMRVDKIGIIKGTDPYEILRIMHTDGDEYEISNQDVIDRLKEWEINSPFDILGADSDWVEIEFKTLPKDLKAFVEEVYDFCPDAVNQGPGSTAELAREIQKTKKLFLWWD